MATIRLTGHIDKDGRIEIAERVDLPPGDVMIVVEKVSPEDEAADDARWEASFAKSQDMLAAMADEALRDLEAGLTDELDPETL